MSRALSFVAGLLVAIVLVVSPAKAATIADGSPVDFVFNVAGQVPATFAGYSYSCLSSCFDTSGVVADNFLAPGSSFGVRFGSTQGGSDFGTAYVGNSYGSPAFNLGGPLLTDPLPAAPVPTSIPVDGVASLFVRIFHVDDVFGLDAFNLGAAAGRNLRGACIANCAGIAPVPLPSALPLFASALGVAALGWRGGQRRRRSNRVERVARADATRL